MLQLKRRITAGLVAAAVLVFGLFAHQGAVDAASLTSRLVLTITGTLSNPLDLGVVSEAKLSSQPMLTFANGVGANQANVLWSDTRTLTTGATEDLDLVGGGLVDPLGVAVAPAKIRAIIITAAAANTTNLTLFGDANSVPVLGTAATVTTLQPGAMFVHSWPATAGIAVTAGTGDIIQVANAAGASATYSIIVIGTSS